MTDWVRSVLARLDLLGLAPDEDQVAASFVSGLAALKHWKHAASRRPEPRELSHREIVADFLASDLEAPLRAALAADADEVLRLQTSMLSDHTLRPGVRELLDSADRLGIGVGIVSNAHSGESHRALLRRHGLQERFAVQVYSDEVGIRKPHPGILVLGAEALGIPIQQCWYVGDTLDRDVVAGRRAGAGAVLVTRSQHTDSPPFAVTADADLVCEDPRGVVAALDATVAAETEHRHEVPAGPGPAPASDPRSEHAGPRPVTASLRRRAAVFLDHGGVISGSSRDEVGRAAFAQRVADRLSSSAEPVSAEQIATAIERALGEYAELKARNRRLHEASGAPNAEVDPRMFWDDLVGAGLPPRMRAVLRAECVGLAQEWGRAKSRRVLRPGIRELALMCRDEGVPVVVVSNTASGRAVRAECRGHGLDDVIAAYICSDEVGVRKPDPRILQEAITLAHADPAQSWFVGDRPQNDALVARRCGIAHRVLVLGGTANRTDAEAALDAGDATAVVADTADLPDLYRRTRAVTFAGAIT
ncbi:HAD family hydrolase [Ruania halotolerans]|nr:HAD-IA family hydrolase [Ruania halotolerans]UFU08037.1 HAD family hydrolase [Ruania halotolerans]